MTAAANAITPESVGTFNVRTAAGTDFIVELTEEGRYATRKPGMRKPDGHSEPSRLPGDFTRLILDDFSEVTVGKPALFPLVVDDQVRLVQTAPITIIEEL